MYEHHKQPLARRSVFAKRLALNGLLGLLLLLFSLLIGMLGYHFLEGLPWLDAMLNGMEHANFFENRATEYSRAATRGTWDEAFD